MQPSANQPKRLYLVSDTDLSIKAHFTDFGTDIRQLNRNLKKISGVEMFDSFSKYESAYQRKLGIHNRKAMDLFYQTVSMKSVGNLTDFVRRHMLESGDSPSRVDAVCRSFDNLNQAHESVLKARHQIEALSPLVEDGRQYVVTDLYQSSLVACREALYAFFAMHKAGLLIDSIQKRGMEQKRLEDRLERKKSAYDALRERESALSQSIAANGGQRLDDIAQTIGRLTEQRNSIHAEYTRYSQLCDALDLPAPTDVRQFHANRQRGEKNFGEVDAHAASLRDEQDEAKFAMRDMKTKHDELDAEIESLAARRSNIPRKQLVLRREMCESLRVDEETLPYEVNSSGSERNMRPGAVRPSACCTVSGSAC